MSGIERIERTMAVINGVANMWERVCEVGFYLCEEGKRIRNDESIDGGEKFLRTLGLVFQGIFAIASCVVSSDISKKMAAANKNQCSLHELEERIARQWEADKSRYTGSGNRKEDAMDQDDFSKPSNPFEVGETLSPDDSLNYGPEDEARFAAQRAEERKRAMEEKYPG